MCDAKASYDYGDSVSFGKSHRFLTANLDRSCWLVFVFRDYSEIALVRATGKFNDFLKSNNCYKSNCVAVEYRQIKDFGKTAGKDVVWIRNKLGITFKEFFDRNWKRESWEGFSDEELHSKTKEIEKICMQKLGSDIPT